jgi:hypothetical protein
MNKQAGRFDEKKRAKAAQQADSQEQGLTQEQPARGGG